MGVGCVAKVVERWSQSRRLDRTVGVMRIRGEPRMAWCRMENKCRPPDTP